MVRRPRAADHLVMVNDTSLKLRTWWHRDELDDRLAHGANPAGEPILARRAEQLRSPKGRAHIADGLQDALDESRKAWSVSAKLPLRRAEIRACANDVAALVTRLRDERPIDVRGAAMAARVLFDGTGPLYRESSELRYQLRSALLALDPIELAPPAELSRVA
jgi:hypothetical protein